MKAVHKITWKLAALALVSGALVASAAAPVAVNLGANSQSLQSPARVATDAAGNCYVTDPAAGCVTVFDAFGRLAATRPGFAGPLAIAVGANGNIFLSEEKAGSVSVFDAQWNFLGKLGVGTGEFLLPNDIAVDPAETNMVFVCDGRANQVKVYYNGQSVTNFGSFGTGAGQFDFPTGVFVTGAGEVFVVDQNHDRVQVFDRLGAFVRSFKLGSSRLGVSGRAQSVIVDAVGRIYVTDLFQGVVKVFTTSGTSLSTLGSFGVAPGQLRTPAGLALDGFNRLRVASVNNSRVEIIGLDSFIHLSAEPASSLVGAGIPVTLSVVMGGPGPFTYQWRRGTNDLTDGGVFSGTTNGTLTLTGTTPADGGDYSVVVTGPTNTFTSPTATVTILTPPSITTNPASQVVVQGDSVAFTVGATGDALAFQWQRNGVDIPEATSPTLQLTDVQSSAGGSYTVTITNSVGQVMSEPAQLSVLMQPVIVSDPGSQIAPVGATVAFEILAQGDLLSYQWRFNGQDIIGANSSALAMTEVQTNFSGEYTAVVTSPAGTATSAVATLTVVLPPAPPRIAAFALLADSTVQFSVAGAAGGNFSILASTNLQDWLELTNLTSATGAFDFTDPEVTNLVQRFYRVQQRP